MTVRQIKLVLEILFYATIVTLLVMHEWKALAFFALATGLVAFYAGAQKVESEKSEAEI